ncbi:hypothetical protein [Priestia megaterium]|uniref:hypothetical protein n=1 Tax=Priestia megaterium TaxID=1404 RepID=UPI0011B71839|nr:hypothetical protein [Priestia megaterium]QDZ88692.1 hypothetical protein D0441_31130 [Priestia megaterium]
MKISIEQFKHCSKFITRRSYNSNNEMFLAVHKKDLTPTEYIAFKRFIKLACNTSKGVFGVTFARINYIVEEICKHDLKETGISRSTVKRMLAKVKRFGLIEVIEREGKNGRQTSNLYIFKKFGQTKNQKEVVRKSKIIEPPRTEKDQQEPLKTKEPIVKQLNHHNTRKQFNTNIHIKYIRKDEPILNSDYVPSYIPEAFKLTVQPFFKDAKEIYKLWGKVRLAHKLSCLDMPIEDMVSITIQAFRESIFAYKHNKVKKDFLGYFFGTLRNTFAVERRKEMLNNNLDNPLFYNFLQA